MGPPVLEPGGSKWMRRQHAHLSAGHGNWQPSRFEPACNYIKRLEPRESKDGGEGNSTVQADA